MDISNEADLDLFTIGPSSVVGRIIAFRILFCRSMTRLRHQLVDTLLRVMYSCRTYLGPVLAPVFSWLNPRTPQGMLAIVTLTVYFLKRYTNVKTRAELAYRRKFWRNMMTSALTYEEWAHAAKMLEKENPKLLEGDFYDEELVRNKLQELRHRRQEGSIRDIIFCMRADLIRNLGNMCNPELHKGRLQAPRLMKDYIDEVTTQLRMVCNSDSEEFSLEEKLSFMHETRHAFGRTALLLSGGASLGAFHVGVVKTLVEHKLLPRIIAGSSVGSIMCAVVATRSWPELQSFFEDSWHSLKFFDQMGGIFTVFKRVMTYGAVHEIRQMQMMLRSLTSNMTFQESYDMTGRILGITVCSPRKHEPPRCLNYLTSPHVVIWSAVTASCAFPGLFEAQELMAKDRSGNIVPYHAPFHLGPEEGTTPARRWRDGSLESDLPMMQLKELFNVNHFIVSQANPHIAPFLRIKDFIRAYGGNFAAKLAEVAEMEVKHRFNQILALGFSLGGLAKLFAQEWEGHVTMVMPATLSQYSKIIQNPSYGELQKAANQGRRCTWEKLSAIKANCAIELALDECVAILNHMRRLKRTASRVAAAMATSTTSHGLPTPPGQFNASRRIPSWNIIARENSAGSIEEDLLNEAAALHNQMHPQSGVVSGGQHTFGTPSWRRYGPGRNTHDGSDSESESADHSTWTRSGGPLMRTSSASKFVDFMQSLGIEDSAETSRGVGSALNSTVMQVVTSRADQQQSGHSPRIATPEHNSDTTESDHRYLTVRTPISNSSIVVSEGDYLQPERTLNGIVLNLVKKEEVSVSATARSNDLDSHTNCLMSPAAVDVQIECPEKDPISPTSDNGEEEIHTKEVDLGQAPRGQASREEGGDGGSSTDPIVVERRTI